MPCPPLSPLPPPPLPTPLLILCSRPLTPWVGQVCRLWGAGASPWRLINYLCHYPTRLLLWCPLPPNGGGAPSPNPLTGRRPLVAPSLLLCLVVGGLCRSGVPPPISCIWHRTKGARSCSGGAPPYPSWSGVNSPSLSCMPCARIVHYSGGTPPSPSWSGGPSLLLLHAVRGERTLIGG